LGISNTFFDVPFGIALSIETRVQLFASFEIFSTSDNKPYVCGENISAGL
jgi:hypothetical protein